MTALATARMTAAETGAPFNRRLVTVSITFLIRFSGNNVGRPVFLFTISVVLSSICLLYTSDAADHGNASAVRTLGLKYPGLKRQTVSDFKLAYVKLKKSKEAEDGDITETVKKKTGRPTLLPENLM